MSEPTSGPTSEPGQQPDRQPDQQPDRQPDRAPGRRTASSRGHGVNLTTVLAVLLPLLTVAGLLLARPGDAVEAAHPPAEAALTTASVVCPAALEGAPQTYLTTTGDTAGEVSVGLGEDQAPVTLTPGRVTTVPDDDNRLVVTGTDDLAPGLVAGRFATAPLAAVDCAPTAADQWFTAVGAGANHDSVLELVNPNAGPAVADVTVYAGAGPLEVPQLRGVSVPGGQGLRLDLGQIAPRRGELAIEVTTVRGRLSSTILDRYDELGAGARASDWLPAQAEPQTDNLLLGLPPGEGSRSLVIGNPGQDEIRATIRFVTTDSTFQPEGIEPLRLEPQSTSRVSLSDALQSAIADGVIGVRIDAEQPVTATLRSFVDGDLSHATPGQRVADETAAIVPPGDKTLVLAGADGVGVATVVARAADGTSLLEQRVELVPDQGATVALPADAVLVTVTPERASVVGSVLVTATGAAVVRLRELERSGLVPDVRPGLP